MDKKLIGLILFFVLSFGLFTSIVVINGNGQLITRLTRANKNNAPSSQKSLMTAYPVGLSGNGQEETLITVLVRNEAGDIISSNSNTVTLTSTLGQVKEGTVVATEGKAVFHLSSSTPGDSTVNAFINNMKLDQTLQITFK